MTVYPPLLADHLGREVTTVCHCWRLTRADGMTTGFTDHDRSLEFGGTVFEPETGFSASEARETLGLAVDTVDVEGALSSERIRDEDIAAGLYDRARVETFLVNWRKPEDFVLVRTATIGEMTRSDERFVAELESLVHTLDQPNGRIVTRSCDAELGDARCKFLLDRPGFQGSGAVELIETPDKIAVSGLSGFQTGWFSFGTLRWVTGARAGRTERIVDHRLVGGDVFLVLQPQVGPAIGMGDVFFVLAGCDKTFSTCREKFENALNFRGFPHLPGNDVAYSYVVEGSDFDGGPVVP